MLAQQEAAFSAKRAWDSSVKSYTLGGIDQMALLDAERGYHRYQDEYQRSRMDHYRGYITLFQALGGGVRPAGTAGQGPASVRPRAGRRYGLQPMPKYPTVLTWSKVWTGKSRGALPLRPRSKKFWQIELPGLYHRSTVGAAWRDLRERYRNKWPVHVSFARD